MERTPKTVKSAYDVTQPVHPESDGTCFGVEYSPRTVQCQKCHDSTFCLIKYREVNDAKVKKVESENRMLDLERVPPVEEDWGQKLYALAQRYAEGGSPMTREELGDALTMEYSIQDDVTRSWWIERWIENFNCANLIQE